jgi:hypothetical protein
MEEKETNWPKVAAWVFGIWSVMLPLSAGVIGYYQNRIADSTEKYRNDLVQLRLEVMASQTKHSEEIAGIMVRDMELARRVDQLERKHFSEGERNYATR